MVPFSRLRTEIQYDQVSRFLIIKFDLFLKYAFPRKCFHERLLNVHYSLIKEILVFAKYPCSVFTRMYVV